MAKIGTIRLKRAYEEPSKDDGTRILVERLWPRGVSKEKAAIELWLKDAGRHGTAGYLQAYDAWLGWFEQERIGFDPERIPA